jgi:hypothetical protein
MIAKENLVVLSLQNLLFLPFFLAGGGYHG